MKKLIKKPIFWIVSVLLLTGIFFSVMGGFLYKSTLEFKENGKKIEATIDDIDYYHYRNSTTNKTNREYDVFISYIVNGKKYNGLLRNYSPSMQVGGKVAIYYNIDNPADYISDSDDETAIIFMLIGGGAILVAIITAIINAIISSKKKYKKQYLMQNGTRVSANIDSVDYNYSYSVNGKHPYKIKCSYKDPYTNKLYIFESKNIWFDVQSVINSGSISEVDVYMDKNDPTKYYMDIESLKKYIAN